MESGRRAFLTNPREKTNFFSIISFAWTIPILLRGYRKDIGLDDIISPLKEDRSRELGDRLEKYV